MAVLCEAISVIVRRDSIEEQIPGGWHQFERMVPNATLCADDELARVGFMSPSDVGKYIRHLEQYGLVFVRDGHAVDMAVVDQMRGPTVPVDWLEFAHLSLGEDEGKVAACWKFEGPRVGSGTHVPVGGMTLATPDWWTYKDSLSANFKFVGNDELEEKVKYLRNENGVDVYLDLSTGKEVYIGRPGMGTGNS